MWLTLIATQLESLNLKLSWKFSKLAHTRTVLAEVRQMNHSQGRYTGKLSDDGAMVDLLAVLHQNVAIKDKLEVEVDEIHAQIDSLVASTCRTN